MNRLLVLFAVLAAVVVALAMASPGDENKWFKNPGSPTYRRILKDDVGQQIDFTHNRRSDQRTTGYLATGDNARQSSPQRTGQPSTGGEASTSKKTGKGK
ncbi:Peroxisomal membrane protein PEX29 [Frankliniella fusca]|uniref:Peroxisomal membrane protein PEX29 n=1 Tax=Frankliniella fusca TaxID=407009 RepID=A0AAE1H1B9_9NEOP|nr:Peroxisomal membrane protein PEX29 [Frankliniella fusca]